MVPFDSLLVRVPVKSAWASKINWTQAVTAASMLAAWFGIDVPEDVRGAIVTSIGCAGTIVTWVLRTFYTGSVVQSSMRS